MRGGVIGIGDLHFPWPDRKAIKAAVAYVRKVKPRYVIQLGDAYDRYADTSFARSLNVMTPEEEHKKGRFQAIEFWKEMRSAAGSKATLFQIKGNHDDRPLKRIREKIPEQEHLVKEALANFWSFDGVKTIHDSTEELILDGVLYTHGWTKFGDHVKATLMSTVCGHLHKGDVSFIRLHRKVIFEANAGFLGDPMALPLRYRQLKNTYKYTKGLFHLDEYGPRFISLET